MNRRLFHLIAGLLLLAAATAGLLGHSRALDRGASYRKVRLGPRNSTTGAVVELGSVRVPGSGVVRAVVCPAHRRDPHGALELSRAAGTAPRHQALVASEERGGRCFEGVITLDGGGEYIARLRATAPGGWASVTEAEIFASRRIAPWMVWPVLAMLLGLYALASAPARTGSAGDREGARIAPVDVPLSPLWALLAYGSVYGVTLLVVGIYLGIAGGIAASKTAMFTAVTLLVQHGLLALVAAWFLGAFGATSARAALGIVPVARVDVLRAVGLGLALAALAAVSTHFIEDVSQSPMGDLVERIPVRFTIGFGALLAPLSEELFFRGVLVRAFGKRNALVGVVAAAVIFTLAHAMQLEGAWVGLVPIAAVALVNGWLRARTGGITQPWIVHVVYNATLSAGLYFS